MKLGIGEVRAAHRLKMSVLLIALSTALSTACAEMEEADLEDIANGGGDVERVQVCFAVHVPGNPTAFTVTGTLFRPDRLRSSTTALLLQHGLVTERSKWDGSEPIVDDVSSFARQVAAARYAVFTVDRLGYGRSVYPNSGFDLTPEAYVQMTHEMVTQIRSGTYKTTRSSCSSGRQASFGHSKVVVGGFSAGAGTAEQYATRHDDVHGVIALVWSNQGFGSTFFEIINTVVVPQLQEGKDYIALFPPEADGFSELCERALLFPPGMRRDVVRDVCGRYALAPDRLSPSGEAAGGVQEEVIANVGNVDVPVLLMFADHDEFLPSATFRGRSGQELDVVTSEIALWENGCNCDVTVRTARDAGHDLLTARSVPQQAEDVIDWLRDQDL
jgi:pimeloyl-ACP methyl ester carboxylesterase